MSYENQGITIYNDSANSLQVANTKKRYYYSPISLVSHKSAKSFFKVDLIFVQWAPAERDSASPRQPGSQPPNFVIIIIALYLIT